MRHLTLPAACAATLLPISAPARPAAADTAIVVQRGQVTAEGDVLRRFAAPRLNDAGQVAFAAGLVGGEDVFDGLYRLDPAGPTPGLLTVARVGRDAPGGGTFNRLFAPTLNDAGHVAFLAQPSLFDFVSGVFVGGGEAGTRQVARTEQSVPSVEGGRLAAIRDLGLDDLGRANFVGEVRVAGLLQDAVLAGDGGGPLAARVRRGDAGIALIDDLAVASGGAAALAAQTSPSGGGGVFLLDAGQLRPVAVSGQDAPGGPGTFFAFTESRGEDGSIAVSDAGRVAFVASLADAGTSAASGLFRGEGSALAQIARAGQDTPDGDGRLGGFGSTARPSVNDAGQVAFRVGLFDTDGGSRDDVGLFRGDGAGPLLRVAREGQDAPGGAGVFENFAGSEINAAGQVAFAATLRGATANDVGDAGLFLYDDDLGLLSVVREGDPLLGSTIESIGLDFNGFLPRSDLFDLNDAGGVAYAYTLADGRAGVAVFTVPEPSSLALAGAAGVALLRRRRNAAGA